MGRGLGSRRWTKNVHWIERGWIFTEDGTWCLIRDWSYLITFGKSSQCSLLQHSASYCNILQYTATPCNILPRACIFKSPLGGDRGKNGSVEEKELVCVADTPSCNTLQHTATHCNTLQHTATLCNLLHAHPIWITFDFLDTPCCYTLQHVVALAATCCNMLQRMCIPPALPILTTATHSATLSNISATSDEMCCMLQCVAVYCDAMCCSVSQCVAVRCSVLQCVAACCSVLQ